MTQNVRLVFAGLAAAALALSFRVAIAQEHPGPRKGGEHPKKTEPAEGIDLDTLARAIQEYVEGDARLKGGYFLVWDTEEKKPLVLTLDKVHKEQLAEVEKGVVFACADFTSNDGVTYDLDFFMKEGAAGVQCTEIHIHKVDGKPRYEWYQDEKDGLWKRRAPSGTS